MTLRTGASPHPISSRTGRIRREFPAERRCAPVWPRWFGPASAALAVLAAAVAPAPAVLALVVVIAAATSRDGWQVVLTLVLASLTLATAAPTVRVLFDQPFLLRFVLAAILIGLTFQPATRRRSPARLTMLVRLLLTFLFVAALGIALNSFPLVAIEGFLGAAVILGIPIAGARYRWHDPETLTSDLAVLYRFLWLLAALGVAMAAAGGFTGRAAGIHANANTYAYVCALGFGLDLGLRTRLGRLARIVTTPVFVLGVLASGSRGALLGILLTAAYLLSRRSDRTRSTRMAVALLLGLSVLLAAPLPPPFNLQDVVERTFGGGELDLSGRQQGWDNMFLLFRQRPVLGHGLRTTDDVLGSAFSAGFIGPGGGHSSFLQMLVETGIVGTTFLFGAILFALRGPAAPDQGGIAARTGASGAVIAGLGHMTGESFVLGVGGPFPLVFWTCVVALTCASSPEGRSLREP